jgi:hypothetical protein
MTEPQDSKEKTVATARALYLRVRGCDWDEVARQLTKDGLINEQGRPYTAEEINALCAEFEPAEIERPAEECVVGRTDSPMVHVSPEDSLIVTLDTTELMSLDMERLIREAGDGEDKRPESGK